MWLQWHAVTWANAELFFSGQSRVRLAIRPVEIRRAASEIRSMESNEEIAMDRIQDWSKGIRQTVKDAAVGVVSLQNEDGSTASGIAWRKGYVVIHHGPYRLRAS